MTSTQQQQSKTLNIKGNRKVVVAEYTAESVFKIPTGLDLEDKSVVEKWWVEKDYLHIKYVGNEEIESIESSNDHYGTFKEPSENPEIENYSDYEWATDYSDDEDDDDDDKELKCLGFRPQSRIGECEGCKAVCEECENLMIMEEEDPRPMFCTEELTEAACEYWIDYNYTIATNSKRWKFFDMTEENLDDGSQW